MTTQDPAHISGISLGVRKSRIVGQLKCFLPSAGSLSCRPCAFRIHIKIDGDVHSIHEVRQVLGSVHTGSYGQNFTDIGNKIDYPVGALAMPISGRESIRIGSL